MNSLSSEQLVAMFNAMADSMKSSIDHLCELDGAIGDADHGVTMSLGFEAVRGALAELDPQQAPPTVVFNTAAKSFLAAVGASAGPLYATAFMRAATAVKEQETLDAAAMAKVVEAMVDGIRHRGKAEAGDKTMLDAWIPAAQAANQAPADTSLPELMRQVAQAANAGAESTIGMQAKKGRSAKLGARSVGHMDAGAASTALLLNAASQFVVTTFGSH